MLHVHRAERSDRLVGALAEVLTEPLADPLTTEIVAVHSRGIERWIAQELATRLGTGPRGADGIAANIDFPFPYRIVADALSATTDLDPARDPWQPDRLVWSLLDLVIDPQADTAAFGPLTSHLGGAGAPTSRRFAALRHVADLFDRYGVHRPEMVRAWHAERDVGADDQPLKDEHAWQPRLWRAARRFIGEPSPAERVGDAVTRLQQGAEVLGLPERLSLFGLTALPASSIEVLRAIAQTRDVHLFLLHPSPALWDRVAPLAATGQLAQRDDDTSGADIAHPILRSWGRDARELQLVLGSSDATAHHHALDAGEPVTLLERLQADVRGDHRLPGAGSDERPDLAADDRSVQVHGCHGRTRQVEVLRDAVLHELAARPDLEPRDIIVMCPDIETFAPLIEAVFGAQAVADPADVDRTDPTQLRVRLADRSIRQTNPVLRLVADLLDLADGRLTASEVLDLATREPVRRRFHLDDEDLQRLEGWVADLNIRWGIDAGHRVDHGLPPIAANSWRAGLDRLLLGVAMTTDEFPLVGDVAPYDGIEGTEVDLAGRLVEFVDRLAGAIASLTTARDIGGWRDVLTALADALTATVPSTRWQRVQLARILDEVVTQATRGEATSQVELTLPEVRSLLTDRLAGHPSRAGQRTGDLVVCTLVPMRSVPHRIVCLLGLDDESFPRRSVSDSDDLVDRSPRVGDRDARSEDRQLLLDAVLAATETLIVTYRARDERTNEQRPPAVPLGELLDVIDRTVRTDGDDRPSAAVTTIHPLQPFDAANYRDGGLGRPGSWSYDADGLAAARAAIGERTPAPPFLTRPLAPPAADDDTLELDDLIGFLTHPVKAFIRNRMQVYLPSSGDAATNSIPIDLTGLESYGVGQRFIEAARVGHGRDHVKAWLRAEGVLPPGALADADLLEIEATADAILGLADAQGIRRAEGDTLEVTVDLPGGRTLVGAVAGVHGDVIGSLQYSRLKAKHRLTAWVRLLAATASHPARELVAVTVGRSGRARPAAASVLGGVGAAAANVVLTDLVARYDRGLLEPLPCPCDTAWTCVEALLAGKAPDGEGFKTWQANDWARWKESADPYHELAFGVPMTYDDLRARPVPDDERTDALDALVLTGAEAKVGKSSRRNPPTTDDIERQAERLRGSVDTDSRLLHLAASLWHPIVTHEHTVEA